MDDTEATTTVALLHDVISTLRDALGSSQAEVAALRAEIRRLVKMVEGLTGQLDELLAAKDEERRAELARLREEAKDAATKLEGAQPEGAAKDDTAATSDSEESGGTPSDGDGGAGSNSRPPGGGGKKPIPGHLDRERKTVRPGQCQRCGGTRLNDKRERIIEEWDYVRAHLRARRTHLIECDCEDCGATTAPSEPPMPFDRATCTMAMLAWLLFAKCALFLPLDRVCRDLELQGAPIPSPTLTRWSNRGADLLAPIWVATRAELLAGDHIATDGTGLLVIHPRRKGKPRQEPHRGQILVFCNEAIAVYYYTPTKDGFHAENFLTVHEDEEGEPVLWKGTITADAVSSQDLLFLDDERVEGGCNAHGFRKFRDEADKAPLLATTAMGFIDAMYTAEAEARERELTGDALLAYRQERAAPHAEKLRVWLGEHIEDLLPSNPVRKAMQYYINHWHALMLWLSDPAVPPDNNGSERALRHVALLRKNSLFAGGPEGAVRVCTVLTLVQTCRLIGVDPFEYLEWALTRIVPHPDNRGLAAVDLTPSAYKRAQQA